MTPQEQGTERTGPLSVSSYDPESHIRINLRYYTSRPKVETTVKGTSSSCPPSKDNPGEEFSKKGRVWTCSSPRIDDIE